MISFIFLLPFLILVFLVIFLYFLFMVNLLIMRGHDLPTSQKAIERILKIILERGKEKRSFYDLGSGRGNVLFAVKRRFPQISCFGIEKRFLQIFFARLKNLFFRKEINFIHDDLFEVNLSKADIVYTYLRHDLMPQLKEKLKRELKKGSIVITNTSNFRDWKFEKVYLVHPKNPNFEKLFVYIKNKKSDLGHGIIPKIRVDLN